MWSADAALIACAFFWGLGFVAMKDALSVYPTHWLLFFRFGGGSVLVGACFFRRIAKITRGDFVGGIVIGVFLFLGMSMQTLGLNYTSAGKQAFLTAIYVVMVPFLVWGLDRVFPGWFSILGSVVCFAGMGLLTSDVAEPLNRGDVLTAVSAVFFAAQIVATARYAFLGDPLVLTFVQFCVTAVLSLCGALLFDGPLTPRGLEGLPAIAFATFFCTFLCFLVQNVAQKYTPPTHASILLGLESVFGLLGGVVLLGEVFTLKMSAGCALIFAAILFVELIPALFPGPQPLPEARVSPPR
ncbi:MAG: DMT family transporter [Synergistaceae bacterium]|nr:DMT family transporter [Synergistaceae bacterium]